MTSSHATHTAPSPTDQRRKPAGSQPLQRAGGWAALVEAATYLVGFGVAAAYLAPAGFEDAQDSPAESLTFLLDHQVVLYAWYLVLYVVAGAALVVLVLGIHDRLERPSPAVARTTTAFGLIWAGLLLASGMIALVGQRAAVELAASDRAEAVSTWSAVSVVQEALGGGIEVVGALWVLLASAAALRTSTVPRGLGVLGLVVGAAGAMTLVPQAGGAAVLFGLGFIAWFVWAGVVLLRSGTDVRTER
ncbi:hypothetical protein [Nocardioides sp. GXQ0305]|uniref:hypothetical protein n=1 Tax=Nocardioides sp. GXQ0305 TaxID=3423912 RepID=UPI003D7D3C15